ncbi:MAG TPA: glycosyltransferase, partial [Armatimonadota bacterium]|nr:glycosyltransferase [Armatimonadota bacterium]
MSDEPAGSRGLLRVLHVVGGRGMTRGGVETWLMHMLRHLDRERVRMDFLVGSSQTCAYDDEIRSFGSLLIPGARYRRFLPFARGFFRALRDHGPYDIVHSHMGCASGYVLRLARRAGIPVLIAHGNNVRREKYTRARGLRGLYYSTLLGWVRRYATIGLGCSGAAVETLFGPRWREDSRCRVLPYGLDLAPFEEPVDRAQVREELGLPLDAFVIGHVGNLR